MLEINYDHRSAFRDSMIDSKGGAFDYDEIYHEISGSWRYCRGGDCNVDGAFGSGQEADENSCGEDLRRTWTLLDQLQRRLLQRISLRR